MPKRVALALGLALTLHCVQVLAAPIVVFAPASARDVVAELLEAFGSDSAHTAVGSYAASSALARQIISGAPADIFISADVAWMNHLVQEQQVREKSIRIIATNRLALVANRRFNAAALLPIEPNFALARVLGNDRLAVADPGHVPAGRYAKAALKAMGVWSVVENRLAPTGNVRLALALVARGEAPLGIIYASDVRAAELAGANSVEQVALFPADSHPPIEYPAAQTRQSQHVGASALLGFLSSDRAAWIFRAHGFNSEVKP